MSQTPPRHLPLVPQLDAAVVAHFFCGSTAPLGTGEHLPSRPVTLQAWQAVVQGPLQHTPCEQYFFPSPAAWHSSAALHLAPAGFSPQDPATQEFDPTHWVFTVQVSKHLVPLQAKGAQV